MIDAIFAPPSNKLIISHHYNNVNKVVVNILKNPTIFLKKYCGLIEYQSHSTYIYSIIFPHPVKSNLLLSDCPKNANEYLTQTKKMLRYN